MNGGPGPAAKPGPPPAGAVVIGVGNEYRRDDGAGPAVLDRLRIRGLPGVRLAGCDGEPARLIELWEGAALAVVVDAVRTSRPRPGRVHRFDTYQPPGGASGASSHAVDLGTAVALARALDRMPERLLLYAIEAADVGFGPGLSPAVAAAAERVADQIAELLTGPPDRAGPAEGGVASGHRADTRGGGC